MTIYRAIKNDTNGYKVEKIITIKDKDNNDVEIWEEVHKETSSKELSIRKANNLKIISDIEAENLRIDEQIVIVSEEEKKI